MPRSDAEPEAAAVPPGRLHLWRHRIRELRGQGSLDSDEGLCGDPGPPPAESAHLAPAGRAASHESGSLSDLEDIAGEGASPPLPAPLGFSKFRLGARRDKSLPPQSESTRKQKPPRVSRLREFTDRLRWSRDEKPAAAPAAVSLRASSSSGSLRTRRSPQPPPVQPAIAEGGGPSEPMEQPAGVQSGISLRQRPASDSDLAWEAAGPPAGTSVRQPEDLGPAHQRPAPCRSASVSRVDACTGDRTCGSQHSPISRPVSFTVGAAAGRPSGPQTLPRRLPSSAAGGPPADRVAPSHARQHSDSLVELGRAPSPLAEEDDETQQDGNSHLLEAMLREIQRQSLSLQRRDSSGLLQRQAVSADGWPDRGGGAERGAAPELARTVSLGPQSPPNEATARTDVTAGAQKSADASNGSPARRPVGSDSSLVGLGVGRQDSTSVVTGVRPAAGRPRLRRPLLPASSDSATSGDDCWQSRFADLSPVITIHSQRIEPLLTTRPSGGQGDADAEGRAERRDRMQPEGLPGSQAYQETPCLTRESRVERSRMGSQQNDQRDDETNLSSSRNNNANEVQPTDGEQIKSIPKGSDVTQNVKEAPKQNVCSSPSPKGKRTTDSDRPLPSQVPVDTNKGLREKSETSESSQGSNKLREQLCSERCDSGCLPSDKNEGQFRGLARLDDERSDSCGTSRNAVSSDQSLDDGQDPATGRTSPDLAGTHQSGPDDTHVPSGRLPRETCMRAPPPLTRQDATGRSVSPFEPPLPDAAGTMSGMTQDRESAVKLNLDQCEEYSDASADKENIRQAVKNAVALLLNELDVNEDQEDPWFPSSAALNSLPSRQNFTARDEMPLRRRASAFAPRQPESKTVDVVRLSDAGHGVPPPVAATDPRRQGPAKAERQLVRSTSLSPRLLRRDASSVSTEGRGGRRQHTVPTMVAVTSQAASRAQRSFDMSAAEARPTEPRKRSFKKRPAIKAAAALGPSTDSVSSTSSDEQRARGRGRSSRHVKLHAPRMRTVSDSATLRPLSAVGHLQPLTEQEAVQSDRRRPVSPSPLAYDSEPDGPGRVSRRRLRGPYGELLEGKMRRAETAPPLGALAESASPSPSPRPGSRRGSGRRRGTPPTSEAVTPARARSSGSEGAPGDPGRSSSSEGERSPRASAGGRVPADPSGSERELPRLADSERELTQLLNDALYDGVGPTARRMLTQITAASERPDAQGRRIFIIGEILDTEQIYVETLRLLVEYHHKLGSLEQENLVDRSTLFDIFHMVPDILEVHEDFLTELSRKTEHWTVDQQIGEIFLSKLTHSAVLQTYVAFVNNWPVAREALLRACQLKPELAKTLETLERSNKGRLSLTQLLITPVQRIPRYELLLKQLVTHTPSDHPDYEPLQRASEEIQQLAARINSLQRAPLRGEARRQVLRELQAAVDGLEGLVTPDREFLRSDMVTMATAVGTKKERCLFLFSDLLVVASVKRRAGSTSRKQTPPPHSSSANGLEPNKYKFLMKIPLSEISIEREDSDDPDTLAKEVERIDEDISTLRQMGVLVCKLHSNHHQVEELVREMAHVLSRELSERHRAEGQLLMLPLQVTGQDGVENISVSFNELEKRESWEQLFNDTKQKLAECGTDRRPVPCFLRPIPVRKTRAGLQFSCAAATPSPGVGHTRDVWVCNSDGYVGQICTLSLQPEPSVTSCNGVCNSRILCVEPVPGVPASSAEPARSELRRPGRNQQQSSGRHSSSDSDLSADESKLDRQRGVAGKSNGAPRGAADTSKLSQPTMWIGTEDGCIYVYNCSDYVRVKKTTVKTHVGAAVTSMAYMEGRVFVGLASGAVSTFLRTADGQWDMQHPQVIDASTNPINKLASVLGNLWICTNNLVKVLDPRSDTVSQTVAVSRTQHTAVQALVSSGFGVWMSFHHAATIRLFHASTLHRVCEVDVTSAVTRMLSGCDNIIRQHKTACLRVTSLMTCQDLLWIGTSAGVILNLPLPPLAANTGWITSTLSIAGISHGHTGHVRFLACVKSAPSSEPTAPPRKKVHRQLSRLRSGDRQAASENEAGKLLVISGGDGYEDFRSSGSEPSGRDDSTNHLLLWSV